jgi:hypothetical protein
MGHSGDVSKYEKCSLLTMFDEMQKRQSLLTVLISDFILPCQLSAARLPRRVRPIRRQKTRMPDQSLSFAGCIPTPTPRRRCCGFTRRRLILRLRLTLLRRRLILRLLRRRLTLRVRRDRWRRGAALQRAVGPVAGEHRESGDAIIEHQDQAPFFNLGDLPATDIVAYAHMLDGGSRSCTDDGVYLVAVHHNAK